MSSQGFVCIKSKKKKRREKRINPIRNGLISKIYLIAYPERITPYKIAELIYGIDDNGNVRMPNNIYREVNKYSRLFDRKKGEGILSKARPLFNEVVKEFRKKGVILNKNEKEKLYRYLDGKFREIVRDYGYISSEKTSFEVFWELIERFPPSIEGISTQKVTRVPTVPNLQTKATYPIPLEKKIKFNLLDLLTLLSKEVEIETKWKIFEKYNLHRKFRIKEETFKNKKDIRLQIYKKIKRSIKKSLKIFKIV